VKALNAGNHIATLLPTHVNAWWPLVEDIFSSAACQSLRADLLEKAIAHGECSYLSVDGTFKVCLPVMGQAHFNASAGVRASFPFQDHVKQNL